VKWVANIAFEFETEDDEDVDLEDEAFRQLTGDEGTVYINGVEEIGE
jgi:hypothetical protein